MDINIRVQNQERFTPETTRSAHVSPTLQVGVGQAHITIFRNYCKRQNATQTEIMRQMIEFCCR